MRDAGTDSDSRKWAGGRIPGTPGIPAYARSGPQPSAIPVFLAVPHAGRAYPDSLLKTMRHPETAALKLEDRYVDRLARGVAAATGVGLLVANAPRAMIDLNRAPDDVDWDMFGKSERPQQGGYITSRRARGGLGLIPRRVPGIGELWKHQHAEAELNARICDIHAPYHACLSESLADVHDRWGVAVLLDLHSMPPIQRRGGLARPEFVLGDRFGASCHGGLVASAFAHFHENDRLAAHNRPYSGGYILERHAAPEVGLHAMQLEIDRSAYLDSRLAEPGEGFANVVELLIGLVRRLAASASGLADGRGDTRWPEAAE